MTSVFLSFSFLFVLLIPLFQCQFDKYYIGKGHTCTGTSDINGVKLEYDFTPLYNPNGISLNANNDIFYYSFTLCGTLNNNQCISSSNTNTWNIERRYISNDTCETGLISWPMTTNESDINITYYILKNTSKDKLSDMIGTSIIMKHKNTLCPNNELTIIFNIFNIPQNISLTENTCEYIFNIDSHSTYVSFIQSSDTIYQQYISTGIECKGTDIKVPSFGVQFTYDFTSLYNTSGDIISIYNKSMIEKQWRFAICGIIDTGSVSCDGNGWCLEEVVVGNDTQCVSGISKWEETSADDINYFANFNSSSNLSIISFVIQIAYENTDSIYNCSNDVSIVHYILMCNESIDGYQKIGVDENVENCVWNFTFDTKYACVKLNDISKNDSGSDGSFNDLSGGSIFIIILMVSVITYLIIGCAFNSFYHGRVGLDAVPNKIMWVTIAKYTKAGCITTKDFVCCSEDIDYQEL